MSTKTKHFPNSQVNIKSKKVAIIAIFSALAVLLVFDLTPLGGNIRFYSEWIRCGRRPLIEDGLPGGGVRFYRLAPVVGVLRGYQTTYYCSPLEAEKAGLSADAHQYQFPELEADKKSDTN